LFGPEHVTTGCNGFFVLSKRLWAEMTWPHSPPEWVLVEGNHLNSYIIEEIVKPKNKAFYKTFAKQFREEDLEEARAALALEQ